MFQKLKNYLSGTPKLQMKQDPEYALIMSAIQRSVDVKEYAHAYILIEALLKEHEEENHLLEATQGIDYYSFNEMFEQVLCVDKVDPYMSFRMAPHNYAEMYRTYSRLLFLNGRDEEGIDALEKALRWNPGSASLALEYAEIYRRYGDYESFAEVTLQAFELAFTPEDISECYINLCTYYMKMKKRMEALVMAMMAADVKTSEKVVWRAMMMTKMNDYDELEKKYGIHTSSQKAKVCKQLGIPYIMSTDVLNRIKILHDVGKRNEDNSIRMYASQLVTRVTRAPFEMEDTAVDQKMEQGNTAFDKSKFYFYQNGTLVAKDFWA